MQSLIRLSSYDRVAFRPRKRRTSWGMVAVIDHNKGHASGIICAAILILAMTGYQVFYVERIWVWWLMYGCIALIAVLSISLIKRIKHGLL